MYEYRAYYLSNYDGDTIRFNIDLGFYTWLKNQSVRLYGVNTPELRGNTLEAARFAKSFVQSQLSTASQIIIVTRKDKKGKYGRWLADIYYDGVHLNKELIDRELGVSYMV